MSDCPACGDYLYADEEWRLREGLAVGQPAKGGDYVHARCADNGEGPDKNVGEGQ
jgi:hypothetical protein